MHPAPASTSATLLSAPTAHFLATCTLLYLATCLPQATWALEDVTCNDVANRLRFPFINHTLALAVIADFQTALVSDGWPAAAESVVAVRQPCVTFNVGRLITYMQGH
jgi:hypothetical protein